MWRTPEEVPEPGDFGNPNIAFLDPRQQFLGRRTGENQSAVSDIDQPQRNAFGDAVGLVLRTEFRQRIAEFNMAAILVTHDEAEARAMGTRGYRVVQGGLQAVW